MFKHGFIRLANVPPLCCVYNIILHSWPTCFVYRKVTMLPLSIKQSDRVNVFCQ